MTDVDQRSIGELLLEADHTARSMLVDAGHGRSHDAADVGRGCPSSR
jgi:hypothetical protein